LLSNTEIIKNYHLIIGSLMDSASNSLIGNHKHPNSLNKILIIIILKLDLIQIIYLLNILFCLMLA